MLRGNGLSINNPLPESSNSYNNCNSNSNPDDAIKERIIKFFEATMRGYKEMVENNFPTLKDKFSFYSQYPIKCICVMNRVNAARENLWGISYSFIPVYDEQECYKVQLHFNENINLRLILDRINTQLENSNRLTPYSGLSINQTFVHFLIGSGRPIGKFVYERINRDLERIFKRV